MSISTINDTRVLHAPVDGPIISRSDDVSDLIGTAWADDASVIVLPVERLDPEFFRLRSLLAGDVIQKLVNYRLRLLVVGDIQRHIDASDALRDFVWESNRGEHVWFVADARAAAEKLEATFA